MGTRQAESFARKRTKRETAAPAAPASTPDAEDQVAAWHTVRAIEVFETMLELQSCTDGWLRAGVSADGSTTYFAFKFHRGRFKGRYEFTNGPSHLFPSLLRALAKNVMLCYEGKRTPALDRPYSEQH